MMAAPVIALDAPLQLVAAVSLILGVAFHLAIRPFEIDSQAWPLSGTYFAALAGSFLSFDETRTFLLASTAFTAGLAGSVLLYRALFHRLHRFPGPFFAKLTKFYAMTKAATKLQANLDVQKLHEQYGDFVRVGPREISINRPSAVGVVYGPPTTCTRSPWYGQVSHDVTKISINSTRDVELHRRRRRAWDRGLAFRALSIYEPRVQGKVELLLSKIDGQHGKAVNMTQYAMFFGFDIMGDVGFSKDFQMLASGQEHPAIVGLHDNMVAVGILGTVPWLMSMLSKIPGPTGSYERFTSWCGQQVKDKRVAVHRQKMDSDDSEPRDVMSWLLRADDENDQSAPPGEGAFQEDSRLMIIAGSDTTSVALTNALYFLSKYPDSYRELRELVHAQFPGGPETWSYEKAKSIPYIDHIIQETLRLKPSVPAGLSRLTPAGGIHIDGVFIPGDTVVSVPAYTIQRDARYWKAALDFVPERWENLSTDKAPWIPFTRGQFSCPGKNLAFMELRMVLSQVALRYSSLSFVDAADAVNFDRDARDTFTLSVPPLPLVFTKV